MLIPYNIYSPVFKAHVFGISYTFPVLPTLLHFFSNRPNVVIYLKFSTRNALDVENCTLSKIKWFIGVHGMFFWNKWRYNNFFTDCPVIPPPSSPWHFFTKTLTSLFSPEYLRVTYKICKTNHLPCMQTKMAKANRHVENQLSNYIGLLSFFLCITWIVRG